MRLRLRPQTAEGPVDDPDELLPHDGPVLPARFVAAAAEPGAAQSLQEQLPEKLRRLADGRLVALAKEAYGYTQHPAISNRHKALAVGSLLYLISPVDAVSDFLPGIGYVDDAAVLTAMVMSVREAAKEVVDHAREAANEVAADAISEARESWANRGVAQVCLSLWAATAAACVGLLYTATTATVLGCTEALPRDPFFWACVASGGLGLLYQLSFGARVLERYRNAKPETQEKLATAVVSLATGRQLFLLALPILALGTLLIVRTLSTRGFFGL